MNAQEAFIQALEQLSRMHPDMRLGQLIENLCFWAHGADFDGRWKIGDEHLLETARKHLREGQPSIVENIVEPDQIEISWVRAELLTTLREIGRRSQVPNLAELTAVAATQAKTTVYDLEDDQFLTYLKQDSSREFWRMIEERRKQPTRSLAEIEQEIFPETNEPS